MVASVNLDLFNKYCRRVKMANIAQTVNVLQAMILTRDGEMVKTPSYYVFKMYKVHHDAVLLPSDVVCDNYSYGDESVPALSTTASKAADGKIHLTISNLDPHNSKEVVCEMRGSSKLAFVSGNVVTGEKINSYNDFGKKEEVSLNEFKEVKVDGNMVTVTMPAKSVVMVELK
jgi:alpha-N-arabinofuranosidase